jgi:hypothetical protein
VTVSPTFVMTADGLDAIDLMSTATDLFPVFAPITVLLYLGLRRLAPVAVRPYWHLPLLVILAMLDITGFTTVHIPTYLR